MVMARPKWQPVKPAVPADDPLPWLTATWGDAEASLPVKSQEDVTAALAAAEKALNSLVVGLAETDTSYRLMLGKSTSAPAATNHGEHLVFVGTKPWSHYAAAKLTFGQMVAVFTGLAYHEVGHIILDSEDSESMRLWTKAVWSSQRAQAIAHATDNVCRDLRLEAEMQQRYPGFADALKAAMWWVSARFDDESSVGQPPDISDVAGRLAAFVSASRYPWEADWSGLESLRDTWLDWAARSETASDIEDVKTLVVEAVDRILDSAPDSDPKPETEGPTCGPQGPEGEKPDDDEGGTKTKSSGGDDGDSESEDSDEQEGRGAEPTDDDTEGDDGEGKDGDTEGEEDGDDADGDDGIDTEGDDMDDFGGPDGLPDESDESDPAESEPQDGDADDGDPTEGDPGVEPSDDDDTQTDPEGRDEDTETAVDRHVADDSQDSEDTTTAEDIQQQNTACGSKMSEDPDDVSRQANITGHARSSKTNKTMTFEYNDGVRNRRRTITEMRLNRHADEVYGYDGDQNWQHMETEMTASLSYETHKVNGVRKQGFRRTKADVHAQQALAGVMHSAKRGPGAPEFAQRTGRIDRRRVGRLSYGEGRVFQRPDAAAPQKVKVGILVDASGSMGWGETRPNIERAAQAARDLAGTFESLPWASGFVAAHTTAYGSGPVYIPIWASGEPLVYMDDLLTIGMNGNEDGFAVAMTAENVLDGLKANERGVVIVISDGAPAYSDGETHTRSVVDEYRKRGLRVVSVAISEDMRAHTQHAMFGANDVVEYSTNAAVFAQRMAQVIGSSI